MSDKSNKQKKQENLAMYVVYAAAAYFGMQFLFKRNTARGATVTTTYAPTADPVPQQPIPAYEPEPVTPKPKTKSSAKKATAWITENFPLRKGMKGANVKALQAKLGVAADGAFGNNTEAALMQQYGIQSVSREKFASIVQGKGTVLNKITDLFTGKPANQPKADTTPVLKMGSRGRDVYRLQKWLGFKDKKQAKKGELVADSIFGKQTQAALQKKTGQTAISVGQLNALMLQGGGILNWLKTSAGIGQVGEVIITQRDTTVLNDQLRPHRRVRKNTLLGKRVMELTDPEQDKSFTQFQTIDGHHRWVDNEDV